MAVVTTWVREALSAAPLYASLDDRPDVAALFPPPAAAAGFAAHLDASFLIVFNQHAGYYQLKRFLQSCGEANKLSFIEDATEYRGLPAPQRLERGRALLRAYGACALFTPAEWDVSVSVQPPTARAAHEAAAVAGGEVVVGGARAAAGANAAAPPPPAPGSACLLQPRAGGGGGVDGTAAAPLIPTSALATIAAAAARSAKGGPAAAAAAAAAAVAAAAAPTWEPAAAARAARLLNGLPSLLLEAYAMAAVVLSSPRALWAEAAASLAAGAAPPQLLDDLLVACTCAVAQRLYPRFLASHCFTIYVGMTHAAFSRAPTGAGAFRWLRALGRGGYGKVHAAQRIDTGKLYAVKRMDKRLIKARHATRMIVNERDVLASVEHPFVAGLHAAFHDENEVGFALDLCTGGDLEYYLLHPPYRFKEAEIRFIAAEMVLGLCVRKEGVFGGGLLF
jgi:hypothetical protein